MKADQIKARLKTLTLSTHTAGGPTKKDFRLAALIDGHG